MPRPFRHSLLALAAALTLVAPVAAQAQSSQQDPPSAPSFEFRGGRWVAVPSDAPTTQAVDTELDQAEEYLKRNGWRAARKVLLRWFEVNDRRAPLRDRATFLLAEAYFQSGNRILSFYHFDEVMDLFPESRLYPAALQRQYDIADAFLRGYKSRFLYLPIIGRADEGIEMLFRIQNRAPGSAVAERALLRTADHYYATSQFDLAADAYAEYGKRYPRSPLAAPAKLRQAYAQMAQFRGTRFDPTPIVDARQLLSDLIVTEPDIAQQEGLPSRVERIDDAMARKIYHTAEWYRRTDQLRGAAYLYRLLEVSYPNSPDTPAARERLARIPEKFLADPLPTTRPADGTEGEFVPPASPSTTQPATTSAK